MAGRGRGRGKGFSFNIEQLGFERGEALPTPVLQPPPVFPPLQYKPVPLIASEEQEYLLALKQEFRGSLKESKFNIKPTIVKNDVERYSDKYQNQINENSEPQFDWSRFPKELKPILKAKRRKPTGPKPKIKKVSPAGNIEQKLELLEKEETSDAEEEKETKEDEEKEIEDEEEYYDEEEQEEGTDYILTYFDNGENYFDDEDDNLDDGPVY